MEERNTISCDEISDLTSIPTNETPVDFGELETRLEADLSTHLADMQLLEEQKAAIGNPEALGKTVLNVVWTQFIHQIGAVAGEEFIRENNNLPLNLSYEAHVQTVDNFVNNKFAEHNPNKTIYQHRREDWENKFEHHEDGTRKTFRNKVKQSDTIAKSARQFYDRGRPNGSRADHTAVDHTVSAAEIIRDPEMAAYMEEYQRVAFANSDANLNEINAEWNQSKGDKTMREWLETPNDNGQTPEQIWNISPEQKEELLRKDEEARKEYTRVKKDASDKAIKEGQQSRKAEAMRIGGKALRSVAMGLIAQLARKIIGRFVSWLKSKSRNLEALINRIKEAITDFFTDIKSILITSADTLITTVITSAVGNLIRKVWILIKQAGHSIIEAIEYLKNPENRKKSVGVLTLEVGKIIISGLTAAGAIILGEFVEKMLSAIPGFSIPIPLIGSLASILGMFLSGVVMGVIGALILNLIDTIIAKTQKQEITKLQIDNNSEIISDLEKMIIVKRTSANYARERVLSEIEDRHAKAEKIINEAIDHIFGPGELPAKA